MVDFTTLKVAVQETSDFQHRNVDVTEFIVVDKMLFFNIMLLNRFSRMFIAQC